MTAARATGIAALLLSLLAAGVLAVVARMTGTVAEAGRVRDESTTYRYRTGGLSERPEAQPATTTTAGSVA